MHHKWQSYGVWFLRYGAQHTDFFVILDHFLPFILLWTQKIKILKKRKKHLKISSFYKNVPKIMIISYTVPEIRCVTDIILIFYFGLCFALFWPKKSCVQKIMITWCTVPEIWCATDGRTDRQKKWHIEVGAPPKNFISSCSHCSQHSNFSYKVINKIIAKAEV